MVDDFKQFLKIYRMYKKGQAHMDKVKDFVVTHKNEIIFVSIGVVAYKIGFRKGFKAAERAVTHLVTEAAKYVPEVH